jgi:hypothetical protein
MRSAAWARKARAPATQALPAPLQEQGRRGGAPLRPASAAAQHAAAPPSPARELVKKSNRTARAALFLRQGGDTMLLEAGPDFLSKFKHSSDWALAVDAFRVNPLRRNQASLAASLALFLATLAAIG